MPICEPHLPAKLRAGMVHASRDTRCIDHRPVEFLDTPYSKNGKKQEKHLILFEIRCFSVCWKRIWTFDLQVMGRTKHQAGAEDILLSPCLHLIPAFRLYSGQPFAPSGPLRSFLQCAAGQTSSPSTHLRTDRMSVSGQMACYSAADGAASLRSRRTIMTMPARTSRPTTTSATRRPVSQGAAV